MLQHRPAPTSSRTARLHELPLLLLAMPPLLLLLLLLLLRGQRVRQ
jgi:hypothetical protein